MSDTPYDEAQRTGLAAVLDTLVPPSPDRGLPGAGELGLGDTITAEIPELQASLVQALAELDQLAGERGAAAFAELEPPAREDVLRAHAETEPGFTAGMVFHVYSRYYREPQVLEGLGMEARPPHPQGFTMAPTDFDTLLTPVREGPRRYRDPETG